MTPEQKKYEEIITKVAEKHNLPYQVVDRTYKGFWKFIRESLTSLPMKEEMTEEEFRQLRTSINVPSLGKFSCDYDRYMRMRKRLIYLNKIRTYDKHKENSTDVYVAGNDKE